MNRIVGIVLPVAVALALAGCGTADSGATAPPSSSAPAPASSAQVSRQQAEDIALTMAGGGTVTTSEQDDENGRPVWKVEIAVNGQQRTITIDRATGQVVGNEADG